MEATKRVVQLTLLDLIYDRELRAPFMKQYTYGVMDMRCVEYGHAWLEEHQVLNSVKLVCERCGTICVTTY